jgi:hypothetical protein
MERRYIVFKPIEELVVPVVDALTGLQVTSAIPNSNGEVDYQERVYRVSPLKALWPEVRVVILDWSRVLETIEENLRDEISDARAAGLKPPDFNEEMEARTLKAILKPVEFDGVEYYGYYGWGSAVKRNQTLGLDIDIGRESGLAAMAEDASRYLRAFLPSSLYGGAHMGRALKVLVLPDRTVWNGYMLADGFGLIKKSLVRAMLDPSSFPISLGHGRQNYLGWQRFPWAKIEKVAKELILKNLDEVGLPAWVMRKLDADAGGYKRRLMDAEELMKHHPYLRLSANIAIKKMMQEIGTTVPLETFVKIAVPTKLSTVVWDGDHKLLCSRHPMDSWQSQMAHEIDVTVDGYKEELELITSMVVYQTTETSPSGSGKGVRAEVDDEIMGEYDLVITCEDFKMLKGVNLQTYRKKVERNYQRGILTVENITDMVISLTQAYEPGCCVGVEPETWKSQGGDYDGDMAFLSPCSAYPDIWDAAREWLDRDKTWKIKKTKSPFEKRPEMLVQVFGSLVGFATNVVSTTFVVQPDDRQRIADMMYNAGLLKKPTVYWLDLWSNKVIKIMTDGFKSIVNMVMEKSMLRKAQQVISTELGGSATWATWTQEQSPAFTHAIPKFHHQLDPETLAWHMADKDRRREPDFRLHIPPEQYNGTCAEIYKIVQPWIEEQFRKTPEGMKISFLEMIEVLPGSRYIGWAPHVSDKLLNKGLRMVRKFAGLSRMVAWTSSEDTNNFKETWQAMCVRWAAQFSSKEEAVYTLWRAAHHATINKSGAAAVFMGFPDEAMKIVVEKPGLLEQQEEGVVALLVGVDYNFKGEAPDTFGPVKAQVYDVPWKGVFRTVVVLDEPLPDMKTSGKLPLGTVGMCAAELREGGRFYTNPELGEYMARFKRNKSGKSFRAYLTPLSEN